MKKITLLISICISISLTAQNPQGKLFVHTQKSSINEKDVLGFVQYPSLQYYIIDSTELTDMMIYNDKIYIANNDVGIYSIQTNQKIDSVINTDTRQICNWNDKLIITSHTQPYFRVYDIINNHNLEYVIDTLKIKYTPTDIIVSGNWAVMTIDTNLVIVDLLLQDTLATVGIDAPLKWAGYSSYLIEANNEIYVDLEYWTGAPRFSFVKLDKVNLKTDSVFHVEMNMNVYKPQAVSDKIYLTEYPSYYDTNTDSLHLLGFYSPYVVDHDSASDCFFVYEEITNTILCYYDTVVKSSFTLPNYMTKTLFYPESTTSLSSLRSKNDMKIYPIPAKEKLIIEIPDQGGKLRIYNASGSLLISKQLVSEAEKSEINISELTMGLYFIEIENSHCKHSTKFIKVE